MRIGTVVFMSVWTACLTCHAQSVVADRNGGLFAKPKGVMTRWSSFENLAARKGEGGRQNQGAKGHAFDSIKPGETKVLLDVAGSGVVRRMWITLRPRDPKILRGLRRQDRGNRR